MGSIKQMALAFIFAGTILFGFVGVYYVDIYMDGSDSETVFISNSNTNFATIEYSPEYKTANPVYWNNLETSQLGKDFTGNTYFQYPRSIVYQGNDSWVCALNTTTFDTTNRAVAIMEIPNLNRFIIEQIYINTTTNTENDLEFEVSILTINNNVIETYSTDPTQFKQIYYKANIGGPTEEFGVVIDVDLNSALIILNSAQEKDNYYLQLLFDDGSIDGIEGFAWEFNITIVGEPISSWSKADSINLVIGSSIVLNTIVMILSTDEIDIGGYVKDIRNKRGR